MLDTYRSLEVEGVEYKYHSLNALRNIDPIEQLPFSLKILLENALRFGFSDSTRHDDIYKIVGWLKAKSSNHEIGFRPARVLMQDFTAVPCLVDLAAMRTAHSKQGGDPLRINPQIPVEVVIDH